MDATYELLIEGESFADLGIAEIAERAEISRSSFYEYFPDKRALLLSLARRITRVRAAEVRGWPVGDLQDVESIPAILRSIARLWSEYAPATRAITEAASYDAEMDVWWRQEHMAVFRDALQARIESMSREMPAESRLKARQVPVIASALAWMVQQTFFQEGLKGDEFTIDDIVEALSEIFTRVIVGQPSAAARGAAGHSG